jgi:hypothetical protein
MAKTPWKPWHEAVRLRDDLRSGDLPLHMFAADLYEVMMQRGKRPIYEKAEEFFALTYPTFNLRELAKDVVLRLAGKNAKAVRQLELTYGGGKTHTLITLRHLVHDPKSLPDLPAVEEFIQHIGQRPPACRVAALCFDKLDVEKGMEVLAPDGSARTLRQPWSVLAWQIAGEAGLKVLHATGKAEERETAPAEIVLTDLLELPVKEGLGVLVLIDEVLMYAREKVAQDMQWRAKLGTFFQCLTQAATKIDRCCIVASLLATDPRMSDTLGREIQSELYEIFKREREAVVEPVAKEDLAEVLRRRFFTPESLKSPEPFRQQVVAALRGISAVDEQAARQGAETEERFFRSYPFHPDLTEVLYSKWTQLGGFQRTRGVLRTFALALREAEKWDTSPLVGPSVFLAGPGANGMSEALRELVTVADTEEWEGRPTSWTGILDSEFSQARKVQAESVGLKCREIEQAVVATFLHSQPVGQTARLRDLLVLVGQTRPDRIELEKGLATWAQASYWLDDRYASLEGAGLPTTWRLGNRPNLTQMHAAAARNVSDDLVRDRLGSEIEKVKSLTAGASAAGVRVHLQPDRPRDIEDDGAFHYAVLKPSAASDSGKPSAEARRFLEETTGPDKPRVFRNAALLLVASRDGIEQATARVRDYLAWEVVRDELRAPAQGGTIEAGRAQTLQIYLDKGRGRIPDAIRQAYCIVVTVGEKDEVQAFKISVSEDSHFAIIKADGRSRLKETAITAAALLPDGPYNLWRPGEGSRRVKDLAGAFAQFAHLPKMIQAGAIRDTLANGCEQGTFVLRVTRPDRTFRTWWRMRPDAEALADPGLELVLPKAVELAELDHRLLAPRALPGLWTADEISVKAVVGYFSGSTVVQEDRGGYVEPLEVPRATESCIEKAVSEAVEAGALWLLSGPASILAEPVPPGVLTPTSVLRAPPAPVAPAQIMPENLPNAWKDGLASGLSVSVALSHKAGRTLPWKTIRDAIGSALNARFLELDASSTPWPCELPGAQLLKLRPASGAAHPGTDDGGTARAGVLSASAELSPAQVQDLGDSVAKLLDVRTRHHVAMKFHIRVEVGDGAGAPPAQAVAEAGALLRNVSEELELK